MQRLILDTFKRFFNNKSSICIFVVSLVVVFLMLFCIPYLLFQQSIIDTKINTQTAIDGVNVIDQMPYGLVDEVALLVIRVTMIICFPIYSSCLLIPIFLGNIDQNNTIFVLTRKYSRQSLFLAKMIVNGIFTLIFAAFSIFTIWIFTSCTVSEKYMSKTDKNLFLNISGMFVIFIFTIQIIITTLGFFLQKKATMYSILIALLFAAIFVTINFIAFKYIRPNSDELQYLIVYILIPLGIFVVLGSTSMCLGLTKYKKVNLKV